MSTASPLRPGQAAVDSTAERVALVWQALEAVPDPEIPSIGILDLGLIRGVRAASDGRLEVSLSPTYVGCPATEVIRRDVEQALTAAEVGQFVVKTVLSPAWSSDWISEAGRRKLEACGIVAPERGVASLRDVLREPLACPRCRSLDTETVSEFGSTPCKALHRCRACLEPFEQFKCI